MSLFPNYDATDLFCCYHDLHDVGVVDSEPRTALFSMEKNKETFWQKMFFFPHFGQKKCDCFHRKNKRQILINFFENDLKLELFQSTHEKRKKSVWKKKSFLVFLIRTLK